jgi:hypothetical protein
MAEDTGLAEQELTERLAALEIKLVQNQSLRVKQRRLGICGVLVLLVLLLLFVGRLTCWLNAYAKSYDFDSLRDQLMVECKDLVQPELNSFVNELRQDVVPKFTEKVIAEFKENLDEIEQKANDMGENLEKHAREQVADQLLGSMVSGMGESTDQLSNIVPHFAPDEFKKYTRTMESVMLEDMTTFMTERYARVKASLDGLTSTLDGMVEDGAISNERREELENDLIGGILELIMYEVQPGLGREPVVAAEEVTDNE